MLRLPRKSNSVHFPELLALSYRKTFQNVTSLDQERCHAFVVTEALAKRTGTIGQFSLGIIYIVLTSGPCCAGVV